MNDQFNTPDNQKPPQVADKLYNINKVDNATFINPLKDSSAIPKFLGIRVFHTDIFIGREDELKAVHQKLFEGDNLLLLVNGEGGIGKTTLAAQYYRRYSDEYTHLAWVFAENSIADALLTLAPAFKISFSDQMQVDERLLLLLDTMQQLKKPCLLVIDNANDVKELERYYAALRTCPNFHLLLTTRITELEHATTYRIEPLPDAQAEALFKRYYPNHKESEGILLASILTAVGKNTLIIELLAKTLNSCNRLKTSYSLSNLLGDLQGKGILGVQADEVTTPYHSKGAALRREKPEAIIGAMYDISNLSDAERQMLSVFAVLPAESIAYPQIETLLPDVEQPDKTLLALAQKGWLDYNQPQSSFRVSPVVQEITRAKNPQLLNDCEPLISTLIDTLDYEPGTGHIINATYTEASVYSRYAESILYNIKHIDHNLAVLSERVGRYHATTGNLEKALTYFEYETVLFKELYESSPQNMDFKNGLAISSEKLGNTYTSLGDLEKALTYFEYETVLFKELYETSPQSVDFKNSLAISYSKLGETYTSLGDLEKALTYYEDEMALFKELHESSPHSVGFKNGLAVSNLKLGETYTSLGDLEKALTYFEDYSMLSKELYESSPHSVGFKNSLAISYSKLGETYTSLGNLEKALTYFEDCSGLVKELYETSPQSVDFKNGLAISYSKLGETYTSFGDLEKALTYYEKDLQLTKELYESSPQSVDFKNGLAVSYSKLGNTYTSLGDLEKALTCFEDFTKLMKELYETSPQSVDFKNGLAISYSKLGDTYTSLDDLEMALIYYEKDLQLTKELYESTPQSVDFKNGLAISYAKLAVFSRDSKDDKGSATDYFHKAKEIWLQLANDFPKYVEFSKYLKQVEKDLEALSASS
ncbi:MAG: ATP-binding protein [Bacteroidales bacterium]|nr:ATP-binding protein [Bacteroidales bacterium]